MNSTAAATEAEPRVRWLPLDQLLFDDQNPRLEDEDRGETNQPELANLLDELYDAKEIAGSIANFGYFESEVLLGIPGPGAQVIIVEGNRRLAAAKGLASPEMRAGFSNPTEWDRLAQTALDKGHVPVRVPVLVEPDRSAVIATIGYRHISGIEPWEPYQQARYIAERIDQDGLSPHEVSELVGISETQVRSKYRNYRIAKTAEDVGTDRALIEEAFGVWDAALGRVPLRQFIGAPDPGQVKPGSDVIPSQKSDNLRELIGWIFGPNKKIKESRDLGSLADAVSNPAGLAALRQGQSLADATQAMKQPKAARDRLIQHLSAGLNGVRSAASVIGATASGDERSQLLTDQQVSQLLSEIDSALDAFAEQS
jgi:hypothetical protein